MCLLHRHNLKPPCEAIAHFSLVSASMQLHGAFQTPCCSTTTWSKASHSLPISFPPLLLLRTTALSQATPFHVAGDVVPELPHHAWKRLIVPGAEERTAALILSEPHFVNVDKFISRLQNVVPRTQVKALLHALPVIYGSSWEGTAQ